MKIESIFRFSNLMVKVMRKILQNIFFNKFNNISKDIDTFF